MKAVDGEEEECRAAACQRGNFGDLREVHTQLLDDACIDYELATLQTLTGLMVVTVQHAAGLLHLLT